MVGDGSYKHGALSVAQVACTLPVPGQAAADSPTEHIACMDVNIEGVSSGKMGVVTPNMYRQCCLTSFLGQTTLFLPAWKHSQTP